MGNKMGQRSIKVWMDQNDYNGLRLMAFVLEVPMSELVRRFVRKNIDKAVWAVKNEDDSQGMVPIDVEVVKLQD